MRKRRGKNKGSQKNRGRVIFKVDSSGEMKMWNRVKMLENV